MMLRAQAGQLSARDVEVLKRRQANQDFNATPRPAPSREAKPKPVNRAEVEQIRLQLLKWLRS
jgi:hypothetical protein